MWNSQDGATPHRILVVDDDIDNAETVALLVQRMGHECLAFFSAQLALDAVMSFRPDMMLIDLAMPGKDGIEFAKQLRKDGMAAEAVLVAMSGYSGQEFKELAIDAGFDAFLVKPFSMAELTRMLNNLEPLRKRAKTIRLQSVELSEKRLIEQLD